VSKVKKKKKKKKYKKEDKTVLCDILCLYGPLLLLWKMDDSICDEISFFRISSTLVSRRFFLVQVTVHTSATHSLLLTA
jgi:hypothetical protein